MSGFLLCTKRKGEKPVFYVEVIRYGARIGKRVLGK